MRRSTLPLIRSGKFAAAAKTRRVKEEHQQTNKALGSLSHAPLGTILPFVQYISMLPRGKLDPSL